MDTALCCSARASIGELRGGRVLHQLQNKGTSIPLIQKSRDSIWCVWSGDWQVGTKGKKKRVGVNVAINIRMDKPPSTFSEDQFVKDVAQLLVNHRSPDSLR